MDEETGTLWASAQITLCLHLFISEMGTIIAPYKIERLRGTSP